MSSPALNRPTAVYRSFATLTLLVSLLLPSYAQVAELSPLTRSADSSADPLPSWREGSSKQAIIDFVTRVTSQGGIDFVPVPERIATFDNDGTLWAEQPLYPQLFFVIDEIKAQRRQHPEWTTQEPFASALRGDLEALLAQGSPARKTLRAAAAREITIEKYSQTVRAWLARARHPQTGRPYTEMVYQPMLELLDYLRANGFKTYVVSGGSLEFMRVFTERVYGIPPEQVIGSTSKTKWEIRDGVPSIVKQPESDTSGDHEGKPLSIQRFIGRRPIASFGNSDGDLQMLQWTSAGRGPKLCLYVHHTDAVREWAYDRDSSVGHLDKGLDEAQKQGWTVVDMLNDWSRIYPFDKN